MFYDFPILSIQLGMENHLNWRTHIHLYRCSDTAIWNGPVAPRGASFEVPFSVKGKRSPAGSPRMEDDYPLLDGVSTEEKGTYPLVI